MSIYLSTSMQIDIYLYVDRYIDIVIRNIIVRIAMVLFSSYYINVFYFYHLISSSFQKKYIPPSFLDVPFILMSRPMYSAYCIMRNSAYQHSENNYMKTMLKGIQFWNSSGKHWTLSSFLDPLDNSDSFLDQLICNFLKLSDLLSVHYELMPMLDTFIHVVLLQAGETTINQKSPLFML